MTDDYLKHRINSLIIFISLDSDMSKKNGYLKRIINKINEYHGNDNFITIIQLFALFAQKKCYNPYVDTLYRLACVLLFKNDNTKGKITTVINTINTMLDEDNIYFNAMISLLQINKNTSVLEPASQPASPPSTRPSSVQSSQPSSAPSISPLSATSGHPLSVRSEHPSSVRSEHPLLVKSDNPSSVKSSPLSAVRLLPPSLVKSTQPASVISTHSVSVKSRNWMLLTSTQSKKSS